MNKKIEWKRKCPKCGNEIFYTKKYTKIRAEKRNTNCGSCAQKGIVPWNKGKVDVYSEETLKRMRKSNSGKNHPSYGKKRSEETRKRMSESKLSKNNPMYGKHHTKESKLKNRLSRLKNIKKNNGQISPNYNPEGCKRINDYNKKYDFNFQHAENGGEVNIDGYFPDGVDQEKMTIIEIDESHHFNSDGTLKEKDIQRQRYLEGLGYKFIRIRI